MNHDQIVQALTNLASEARWQLSGDDFGDIVWIEGKKPTLEQLEAEIALLPEKELAKAEVSAKAKADLLAKLGISAEELAILIGRA